MLLSFFIALLEASAAPMAADVQQQEVPSLTVIVRDALQRAELIPAGLTDPLYFVKDDQGNIYLAGSTPSRQDYSDSINPSHPVVTPLGSPYSPFWERIKDGDKSTAAPVYARYKYAGQFLPDGAFVQLAGKSELLNRLGNRVKQEADINSLSLLNFRN